MIRRDADHGRVLLEFAEATRTADVDTLAALMEPDAVVWHNHDELEVSAERSNRTLRWLHRTMPDVRWSDIDAFPTPSGFVWQAVITGTASGGEVRVPTCMVASIAESGRIQRIAEYLDPAGLRPLLG